MSASERLKRTQFKKKPATNEKSMHIKLVKELWTLDQHAAAENMQATARSIQHLKG